MSEMAKNARAAMKAKATRMGGKGDPKAKVDASSWSPPEMMNTGAKVGMRPLSRRAFRKGGKVIEKCEGGPAAMRADRKQRKAGGRATSLVTDMINRNAKKANLAREGGDAHVGGYAKGGNTSRYRETVKDNDRWDESKEKWMPRTKRRLTDEGEMKRGPGGKPSDADNPDKFRPGEFKRGGDVEQDKKLVKKAFRQHDEHMHGGKHEDIKLKKGGAARDKYNLNDRGKPRTDEGERPASSGARGVPGLRVTRPSLTERVMNDRDDEPRYRKGGAAEKGGRTKKQVGGGMDKKAIPGDAPTRGYTPNGSSTDNYEDAPPPKYGSIGELIEKKGLAKKNGGGTYYGGTRPTGGRMPRKSGGRAKGKTNISITINPQQPQDQQQQAMMPKMPTPPPMPPPPIAPPGMGPGMPPMPMPPPGPPPGLAGGPPPGMPPMPRKRGGRAYRSYKDMDAGALGGMGRLEKVEIEHGKRVGRLSGGRARSYKDMDAGSLGGMGRIEKIAIQKHKK
jgi:hypothetical protein